MKIELKKHSMTRWCQESELTLMKSAGWGEVNAKPAPKEQAGEEVIRLKPPVKSKATVTAVEEANINTNQGDE
jgi:hypothetical protein